MSKHPPCEVLPDNLLEHRAVRAWHQASAEHLEPESIEVLKLKRKSAVYRLTGSRSSGPSIIAKRCMRETAVVERVVYEELLARLPMPALRCCGFLEEPAGDYCWLFVEDAGTREYSPAEPRDRALAGRWLGTLHRTAISAELTAALPDRGTGHYLQLLSSTRTTLIRPFDTPLAPDGNTQLLRSLVGYYDTIRSHWKELESFCERWPRALVHGDFVIKNLRIRPDPGDPALLVFDWEMSGWGVPATDLAQFLGRCASPDLDVYASVLKEGFPCLDVHDVTRLALYGNVLRILDKIFWSTMYWGMPSQKGVSGWFLLKPLVTLRKYECQMAATLRALDWSRHD